MHRFALRVAISHEATFELLTSTFPALGQLLTKSVHE